MTLDTDNVVVGSDPEPPEQDGKPPEVVGPQRLAAVLSPEQIDALLAETEQAGRPIDGPDGLIGRMVKAVLERALETEMADHLGYERGDPAGIGSPNSRNGLTSKTVITSVGQARIDVPRDRAGTFEPRIVPKHARRLGSTSDMILSCTRAA
jgi:putative transposase